MCSSEYMILCCVTFGERVIYDKKLSVKYRYLIDKLLIYYVLINILLDGHPALRQLDRCIYSFIIQLNFYRLPRVFLPTFSFFNIKNLPGYRILSYLSDRFRDAARSLFILYPPSSYGVCSGFKLEHWFVDGPVVSVIQSAQYEGSLHHISCLLFNHLMSLFIVRTVNPVFCQWFY